MAIEHQQRLHQGYYKNAFCKATLPDNNTTMIKPQIGYPFSQPNELWIPDKTIYGIQYIPRHWFDNITSTLVDMVLTSSTQNPFVYISTLTPGGGGNIH